MGSEQSSRSRISSGPQQTSEAELQELRQRQRLQHEKKCQEILARATVQNSQYNSSRPATSNIEKKQAPYNYTRDDSPNVVRESNRSQSPHPNVNAATSTTTTSSFQNNNQRNTRPTNVPVSDNNNRSESKERNRSPHNDTKDDLQNAVKESNRTQSLHLTVNVAVSTSTSTTSSFQNNNQRNTRPTNESLSVNNNESERKQSETEVQRLQFQKYRDYKMKMCKELLEQVAAQNSQHNSAQPATSNVARNQTPFDYTRDDSPNVVRESNRSQSPHPNVNAATSTTTTSSFQNNNQRNTRPTNVPVSVNNNRSESKERNRSPYNYTRNDLQNVVRESNRTQSPHPNANAATSTTTTSSFQNNNQRNTRPTNVPVSDNNNRSESIENRSAPYNYTRDDLQNVYKAKSPTDSLLRAQSPHLNINATTSTPSFRNNDHVRTARPPNNYVSVNHNGFKRQQMSEAEAQRQRQRSGTITCYNRNFQKLPAQNFGQNLSQPASWKHKPAPRAPSAPPMSRDWSVNRFHYTNNNNTEGDCPTCGSMFGVVIYQCGSGHSACNDCKIGGRVCRLCGEGITNMRNYDLEGYVAQRTVPCPNKIDGCRLYIKLANIETHMRKCPFKEQQCPLASVFGNCCWKGRLSQIADHFDMMHPTHRHTNVDSELRLMDICNNSQQLHLVLLGVYNFLFHVKVSEIDRSIYMAVQIIGTKMSASKWYYEVHVYNKSECRRKYYFTDNCSSSRVSVNDIFREKKCAVLPLAYASTLFTEGSLTYKFFIKKNNEGPKDFGNNQRDRGRYYDK